MSSFKRAKVPAEGATVPRKRARSRTCVGNTLSASAGGGGGGGSGGAGVGCGAGLSRGTSAENQRPNMVGGRKLTIRPFRVAPKVPANFADVMLKEYLMPSVGAVLSSTRVPFSLEFLYGKVEDACLHKQSSKLFEALHEKCNAHVKTEIAKLKTAPHDTDLFLTVVKDTWERHCAHMMRIRSIFLMLDRTYFVQGFNPDARSLWGMGLTLFRTHLSETHEVETKIVASLLTTINRERDGETIDVLRVKKLLCMLSEIGTYSTVFENKFIIGTDLYYRKEGVRLVAEMDVPTYLKHAEKRIREEQNRVIQCLNRSTRKELIATVDKRLIADHVKFLLDKGFDTMCDEKRNEDLKRCHALFSRANPHMVGESAFSMMKADFVKYVKSVGHGVVMNKDKDFEMVQNLLELKSRLDQLVVESFSGLELFVNAVSHAFESFVNVRENKPAELIAKFVDRILRTGNKGFSEEELENTLDRTLTLFRYIDGKDVFEAFYKKDLAKRLLYDKSASLDLEKSMISKLKAQCGSQFTSKLEAMFRDVDASKDLMHSFKNHSMSRTLGGSIELNVHVLEAARWPLATQVVEIKLPMELSDYQETFKQFYLTKHNGRKLSWQHIDGSCVVKATFPRGTKILSLSLYQAVALMLFNDKDELSYGDIRFATGIEDAQLSRTMLSLACGKVRVLQKRPKGPKVNPSDVFYFNKAFVHKQTRIKVNAIQMKETVEENAATTEKVFQERNCQIDAALVRIMKTRKQLDHTGVIAEIYNHLRFPCNSGDIKKRIESLIDREYLERSKDNPNVYVSIIGISSIFSLLLTIRLCSCREGLFGMKKTSWCAKSN